MVQESLYHIIMLDHDRGNSSVILNLVAEIIKLPENIIKRKLLLVMPAGYIRKRLINNQSGTNHSQKLITTGRDRNITSRRESFFLQQTFSSPGLPLGSMYVDR